MSESSGKPGRMPTIPSAVVWLAALTAAFALDLRAGALATLASLGALGVGLSRAKPSAAEVPPARSPATPRQPQSRAPQQPTQGLLHPEDRERLVEWISEPLEILKAAEQNGALTGFNQARACPGMGRISAWRRSRGEAHPEADALCKAAEEAVQTALIEAAEYFSPLIESMGRRGEQPHELIERSRERIFEVRRQTLALLAELRVRLEELPATTQASFGF